MKYKVSANSQSVVNSGITDDYKLAMSEYIWNGFDAGATTLELDYSVDVLGKITAIKVRDNGKGINGETLSATFGAFLNSQKRRSFQRTSEIRGKKGKGRFAFKAFCTKAVWTTNYINSVGDMMRYSISIDVSDLSKFDVSDERKIDSEYNETGTEVSFFNIEKLFEENFSDQSFVSFLYQQYAWFLCLKKSSGYEIKINGVPLSYESIIAYKEDIQINVDEANFCVTYIRWKAKISDKCYFYMMDSNMQENHKVLTSFNNNTIDFYHSLYVVSDYFDNFIYEEKPEPRIDKRINQLSSTYKKLTTKLKDYLRDKEKEFVNKVGADNLINDYEANGILPVFKTDDYSQARRQDLIETIRQIYSIEPKIFKNLQKDQKKTLVGFLNLLLDSSERENILTILEDIVNLTDQDRCQLAKVLKTTKITNISKLVNLVHDRLKVIECLKLLVFDLRKFTTERGQIQTIVENNYWLFGESYQLVTADEPFEKLLTKYICVLDGQAVPKDAGKTSIDNPEANRRPDIFMCRHKLDESGAYNDSVEEHIIVELKRPNVNIGIEQYRQIEDYFRLIKKEPRFNSSSRKWRFYVVSSVIDDEIKDLYKAFENYHKRYLVHKVDNYEIYAMSWDDVFQDFKLKNQYILSKLNFDNEQILKEIEDAKNDAKRSVELTEIILKAKASV